MFATGSVLRPIAAALLVFAGLAAAPAFATERYPQASRIVSIGGTITEILYALGAGDRIVARDSTSYYPDEANAKPDVGYMRALSPEGIFAQRPDLILAEDGSGPADAISVLKAGQVPFVTIETPPSGDAIPQKIRDTGVAVGLEEEADGLAKEVEASLETLKADVAAVDPAGRKRVLFVLSLANGRVMAAGTDTEAGALIEMAGGINAAATVSGYKPLSDEAVIAAAPDLVLVMQTGQHAATADEVFSLPAFQTTPAAANKALLSMDGLYLVGFGPRTPAAARELAVALYPGQVTP
ncbi:ABC transporter substrate-binding protein [Rhizobiaceae bacterium BDR2-2]|uniref:ABC transporter substrate-binding protein n=1 Tax=Ectorhizobium quercum TaxID=2965071 RepID=A0AAE3N6S4_9HYPH|nr:ABC transporter substrate-binding protein [Ectorhizobium quercum]MCX8999587.1 ABC transporter substrate-binding protein [Ectorhizobium quercum]